MAPPFVPIFFLAAVATAALAYKMTSLSSATTPAFASFQKQYLFAYLCMVAGDWMQGPYVYALYASYGYSTHAIAVLFVAGFGSSMIFGTIVGSFADKFGRKKFALLYVLCYVLSCCSKHINSFAVLLFGRLLGGVATSLLFSVFDAWMINEHNARGFDPSLLSDTFTKAIFTNSVVAILSGLVANAAANHSSLATMTGAPFESGDGSFMIGGYCAPFDVAILVMLVGGSFIFQQWGENYGARSDVDGGEADNFSAIKNGIKAVVGDEKILLCGLICSLFEGSMYAVRIHTSARAKRARAGRTQAGRVRAGRPPASPLFPPARSFRPPRRPPPRPPAPSPTPSLTPPNSSSSSCGRPPCKPTAVRKSSPSGSFSRRSWCRAWRALPSSGTLSRR